MYVFSTCKNHQFWAKDSQVVVFWDVSHIQPTDCFRDAAVGTIASSPDLTLAKTENASVSSSRVLVAFQWRQYSCMNSREFTVFLQVFGNTMFWPAFTFIMGYVDTTHWKSFSTCFVLARHFFDPRPRRSRDSVLFKKGIANRNSVEPPQKWCLRQSKVTSDSIANTLWNILISVHTYVGIFVQLGFK